MIEAQQYVITQKDVIQEIYFVEKNNSAMRKN